MTLFNDQGTAATEGAASIQLLSDVGGINVKSGLNGANAILLTADGGTSETIVIHADQGTGADSIKLLSDAGGITATAGGAIDVNATGAITVDSAGISIDSSSASNLTTSGGALTVTSAAAATWSTAAGALTLNGTGGIAIQEGGSTIIGISDARALATTNTAAIDLDGSGAIQINSSGAAISIGNDNVDQTVNLATAGTRTLNIGINDGTDETTINLLGRVVAAHDILLDSTPPNNDGRRYSGITATFTAGETLEAGEVVYLKAADTKMWKAVSVASGTGLISADIMCVAMVAEDVSADNPGTFLLQGFLRDDTNFPTYAVGETLYVPEAEESSLNVPEGAVPDSDGDFVQVIGWAADANTVYFNPDFTIIEHA